MEQRQKRLYLPLCAFWLAVLLLLGGCSAKTGDASALLAKDGEPSVSVCIDASAAVAYGDGENSFGTDLGDGMILPATAFRLEDGDSVLTVLRRVTEAMGIQTETQGGYVEGIANLYEFDCGGESGWVYTVNGASPSLSASAYFPKDGDVIVWTYITSFANESIED